VVATPPSSQYAAIPLIPTLGPSGGQIPSEAALLRVEFNTTELTAALNRFLLTATVNVEDAVIKVALELLGRIQQKTPVDTGRLRNSFHAVLPGQTDGHFRYQDNSGRSFNDPLGVRAQRDVVQQLYEAIVGTDVVYGPIIEAGHSRKAPSGMVSISVAEMVGALDAAVEKVLNDAGKAF
jgi:hypothetical protein